MTMKPIHHLPEEELTRILEAGEALANSSAGFLPFDAGWALQSLLHMSNDASCLCIATETGFAVARLRAYELAPVKIVHILAIFDEVNGQELVDEIQRWSELNGAVGISVCPKSERAEKYFEAIGYEKAEASYYKAI